MTTVLATALPLLWPLLATTLVAILGAAFLALRAHLAKSQRWFPLADVADLAGQALDAAVKAAGAAGPTPQAISAAETALFNALKAHRGQMEADAEAELRLLCTHAVALKAGAPVTAPGGGTVVLPKADGFATIPALGLLAVLATPGAIPDFTATAFKAVLLATAVLVGVFFAFWLVDRARSRRWPRRPPLLLLAVALICAGCARAAPPAHGLPAAVANGWPGVLFLLAGAWAVYALARAALSIHRSASTPGLASYWVRRSERGIVPVVVIVVVAIIALLGGGTAALVIAEHKGPIVLNCAEAKLSAGAAAIEGQVATILAGGGDCEGALLALGARVGSDVVACAVTAILTPLDGGTRAALAPQVRANGEAFLTSHGYAVPR